MHPSQVQGEGPWQQEPWEGGGEGGEKQAAGHTTAFPTFGVFFHCGNHALTPMTGRAVLVAIYITRFYLLSPSQQPRDVCLIITHI